MSYFDAELKVLLPFTVLGIIIGCVSFYINHTAAAVLFMLIVAIIGKIALSKLTKIKENWKWWISNGIIVYVFIWLVVWTVLFNIVVL